VLWRRKLPDDLHRTEIKSPALQASTSQLRYLDLVSWHVTGALVAGVCRSSDDSFHSVKIPSMFLSKLPVSSFLPAATLLHEFHQVISFLFLFFSPSNAFVFFML
jgi:hypothetical protein